MKAVALFLYQVVAHRLKRVDDFREAVIVIGGFEEDLVVVALWHHG